MLKNNKEKGFSIIEVLIVLVIAGVIMLIVFLAVPSLQRNSRNNGRKTEASKILNQVSECLTNSNGNWQSCNSAAKLYGVTGTALPESEFKYISNLEYTTSQTTVTTETAIFAFDRVCNGNVMTATGANSRSYAIQYKTEAGGGDLDACLSNK